MLAAWELIEAKWPRYFNANRRLKFDLNDTQLSGVGRIEIFLFSFDRLLRSEAEGRAVDSLLCIGFRMTGGQAFSEACALVAIEQTHPEIAGMVEPFKVLWIASTDNGEWLLDQAVASLQELGATVVENASANGTIWFRLSKAKALQAIEAVADRKPPALVRSEDLSSEDDGSSSYFAAELALALPEGFSDSGLCDVEWPLPQHLAMDEAWRSDWAGKIKRGQNPIGCDRQRIVVVQNLECFRPGVSVGTLGWTVPEKGVNKRRHRPDHFMRIICDSGVELDVRPFWIEVIREDSADQVAVTAPRHRGSKVGNGILNEIGCQVEQGILSLAEPILADPFYGYGEVYAFTFPSLLDEGVEFFPLKVGMAWLYPDSSASVSRVASFHRVPGDAPLLLFVGRCDQARDVEAAIHRELKSKERKIESAPGKEWFLSNASEVADLYRQAIELLPNEI
jgi:hypothetical protein